MIESNSGAVRTDGVRWRLGGESCLAGEVVDGVAVGAVGGAQRCGDGRGVAGEFTESGTQEPGVQAGEEQGVAQPGVGDLVAVCVRESLDEAVDAVVADFLDAEQAPVGGEADLPQCGKFPSPFPMPKSPGSLMTVSVRSALPSL